MSMSKGELDRALKNRKAYVFVAMTDGFYAQTTHADVRALHRYVGGRMEVDPDGPILYIDITRYEGKAPLG